MGYNIRSMSGMWTNALKYSAIALNHKWKIFVTKLSDMSNR